MLNRQAGLNERRELPQWGLGQSPSYWLRCMWSVMSSPVGLGRRAPAINVFYEFYRHFQDKKLKTWNCLVGELYTLSGGLPGPEHAWNKHRDGPTADCSTAQVRFILTFVLLALFNPVVCYLSTRSAITKPLSSIPIVSQENVHPSGVQVARSEIEKPMSTELLRNTINCLRPTNIPPKPSPEPEGIPLTYMLTMIWACWSDAVVVCSASILICRKTQLYSDLPATL